MNRFGKGVSLEAASLAANSQEQREERYGSAVPGDSGDTQVESQGKLGLESKLRSFLPHSGYRCCLMNHKSNFLPHHSIGKLQQDTC